MIVMLTQFLLVFMLLSNNIDGPFDSSGTSKKTILVHAKKNDDEHLFLHMPEGGSKVILPLPLFIPFPFPIIEDVEKIYHRKKVLVITEKHKKLKKLNHHELKYDDYYKKDLKYDDPYGSNFSTYYDPHYNADYNLYDKLKYGSYDDSKHYGSYDDSKHYGSYGDSKHYGSSYDDPNYSSYYDKNKHYSQHDLSHTSSKYSSSTYGKSSKYASASSSSAKYSNPSSKEKSSSSPSKYTINSNHDYQSSSSDSIPSVYESHNLKDDGHYSVADLYNFKKKLNKKTKKTTFIAPMSEYDEDPTKYFPYDVDEGEDVEHVEYSTDDGKSKDINPKTIIDKIRKFLTQENIKLKVNIDYNKDKLKHEKRQRPERTRSIGKIIDEQIKKLEDEEHDNH